MNRREPSERELIELGEQIAAYGKPRASARLRSEIHRSLLTAPAPRRAPGFRLFAFSALRPVLAAALVVAVLVGASGSAAASSLPGDPAFALKRGLESVEVAFAPDDIARLDALVTQSDRRLLDLQVVLASRLAAVGVAVSEYELAVSRVDASASIVSRGAPTPRRDAALLAAAASSTAHIGVLQSLAARLPEAAQPGIQRAIEAQQRIHGRSGAPGLNQTPPFGSPASESGAPGRPATSPPGRPSFVPTPPQR